RDRALDHLARPRDRDGGARNPEPRSLPTLDRGLRLRAPARSGLRGAARRDRLTPRRRSARAPVLQPRRRGGSARVRRRARPRSAPAWPGDPVTAAEARAGHGVRARRAGAPLVRGPTPRGLGGLIRREGPEVAAPGTGERLAVQKRNSAFAAL